jgi:hypothetical protein
MTTGGLVRHRTPIPPKAASPECPLRREELQEAHTCTLPGGSDKSWKTCGGQAAAHQTAHYIGPKNSEYLLLRFLEGRPAPRVLENATGHRRVLQKHPLWALHGDPHIDRPAGGQSDLTTQPGEISACVGIYHALQVMCNIIYERT